MLGTPFVVIWLVGLIADLDIDSWLIKGLMYAGVWVAVQFLSKYVPPWMKHNTTQCLAFVCFPPPAGPSRQLVSLCRAFFDHSMHSALPLGIYLATKFWMYTTWFYWFWNDILLLCRPP